MEAMCDSCGLVRDYSGTNYEPSLKCQTCNRRQPHHVLGVRTPYEVRTAQLAAASKADIKRVAFLEDCLTSLGVELGAKPIHGTDLELGALYAPWEGVGWYMYVHPDATLQGRERMLKGAMEYRERGLNGEYFHLEALDGDLLTQHWMLDIWQLEQQEQVTGGEVAR